MESTSNNQGGQRPQTTTGVGSSAIRPRFYNRNRVRVARSAQNNQSQNAQVRNIQVSQTQNHQPEAPTEIEVEDYQGSASYANDTNPVPEPDYYSDSDYHASESTGAREINPVDPVSDFRPVNPDISVASTPAPKQNKILSIGLTVLCVLLAFAGGLCFGLNWDKIFKKSEAPTAVTPVSDVRELTADEIANLKTKVAYLGMAENVATSLTNCANSASVTTSTANSADVAANATDATNATNSANPTNPTNPVDSTASADVTNCGATSDSLHLLFHNSLPHLFANSLTSDEKIAIALHSLKDEFTCADGSANCTISAERAASRYYEIFGNRLSYVDQPEGDCFRYALSADRATYQVSETCDSNGTKQVLSFGEIDYRDGYAYLTVSAGSYLNRLDSETPRADIYKDVYTTDEYLLNSVDYNIDAATTVINSANRAQFATYSLRFEYDETSKAFYFLDAEKITAADTSAEAPSEEPEASAEPTAPAETEPAEASAEPTVPEEDYAAGDDISYETDPDAPPCPRSNPYARCVE